MKQARNGHQILLFTNCSKSRNCEYFFPMKEGIGLNVLLPNVTEDGKAVLKSTLIYDPENRINVKRLLENHYFDDFRLFSVENLTIFFY